MKKYLNFNLIVILFSYLFYPCVSTTNFVELVGYIILADPLQTLSSISPEECGSECVASTDNCVGFEFTSTECKLFTTIRNIITNNTACSFYVYDRRNETNPNQTDLSEVDQLIYSNAYFDKGCPQGTTDEITYCSIAVSESTCSEYAEFFNATFDESKCIMAVNRSQWYCEPNSAIANYHYFTEYEGYCYFKTTSTTQDMAYYISRCQAISAKSNTITILSAAENDYVTSFVGQTQTMLGLYIPANKTPQIFEWADGSTSGYRSWLYGEPNNVANNTEFVVILGLDGFWRDKINWPQTNLFCKENALTLNEYAANCNTIDNCVQIN